MLIKLFLKEKPTIVHGNTPKASLLSMIAAFVTRVPIRIYMCHGLRFQGYDRGLMRKLLILMEKLTCFCATSVYCVSQGVLDSMIDADLCKGKAKVILNGSSNGIDLDYFNKQAINNIEEIKEENNINKGDFVFIFIGRIVKDKGIEELLYAFNKLSEKYSHIRLLIIGPKENCMLSSDVLETLKNNSKITLKDQQKDIRPFLSISDVLVLPSYREGLGVVLMEAAAMGVPVITSNIIGCNNVVENEVNGIFVNPKDKFDLIEKMENVLNNTRLLDKMKRLTTKSIEERFNQKIVWDAFLKEYQLLEKDYVQKRS